MEREIGNVAADAGLKAFRYLSFAPVIFDALPPALPIPPEAEGEDPKLTQPEIAPPPLAEAAPFAVAAPNPALGPEDEPVRVPIAHPPAAVPPPVPATPAFTMSSPPAEAAGLFSQTPDMPYFTTAPDTTTSPAFVTPAMVNSQSAPIAAQPLADLPDGTLRMRRLAELRAGGASRPLPASSGAGTGRRYALLQDIRSDLAGGNDRQVAARPLTRKPPA